MIDPLSRHPPDALVGATIGDVVVEELIASGGMGHVYRGRQPAPPRPVAVKFMRHGDDPANVSRFLREAELQGLLTHPAIPAVYTAGEYRHGSATIPYIVMEFIPAAEPLFDFCIRRRLSTIARLRLFLEACDAIAEAHAQGIVHRDLSRRNLLMSGDTNEAVSAADQRSTASTSRVKVIDFGIAARFAAAGSPPDVGTDAARPGGTRGYMSPEQVGPDLLPIDARSDVYSLGVLLHELITGDRITGRWPEGQATAGAKPFLKLASRKVAAWGVGHLSPGFRGCLGTVVKTCLARELHKRYRDAGELAAAIRHLLEADRGRPVAAAWRKAVEGRRWSWPVAATVLLGACGLVMAAGMMPFQKPLRQGALRRPSAAPLPPPSVWVSPEHGTSPYPTGGDEPAAVIQRKTPLDWVKLRLGPVTLNSLLKKIVTPASFRLTRDGLLVDSPGLSFEFNESDEWNVVVRGFERLTAPEGHYRLELVEPVAALFEQAGGPIPRIPLYAWTMPPSAQFRFNLHDETWDDHVVAMQGLEMHTQSEGRAPATFVRPLVVGEEGTVVMRFPVDFPIETARLQATLAIWTTVARPFGSTMKQQATERADERPLDPAAEIHLDVSRDGQSWNRVNALFWGHAGISSNPIDLEPFVAGSREVWVRARLTGTQPWQDQGLIFVQFLRTTNDAVEPTFTLDLTGPLEP